MRDNRSVGSFSFFLFFFFFFKLGRDDGTKKRKRKENGRNERPRIDSIQFRVYRDRERIATMFHSWAYIQGGFAYDDPPQLPLSLSIHTLYTHFFISICRQWKNWFFSSAEDRLPSFHRSNCLNSAMTLRNGPDTAQVEEIINSTVIGHNETKQKEIVKLSLSLDVDWWAIHRVQLDRLFWPSI